MRWIWIATLPLVLCAACQTRTQGSEERQISVIAGVPSADEDSDYWAKRRAECAAQIDDIAKAKCDRAYSADLKKAPAAK